MKPTGGNPPGSEPLPPLWRWDDPPAAVEAVWRGGGIVAIPSESTYGLAVDPTDARAVERLRRRKGRPSHLPFPVVAGSIEDLERLGVRLDLPILRPAIDAWPAPLTVVAPLERPVPAALGRGDLAVRVPDHPALCALLRRLRLAVTATSANRSGQPPVTTAAAAQELLAGEEALVIDDGELAGGPPSTLVAIRGERLVVLREGRFPSRRLLGR